MSSSILVSTKKMLGVAAEDTSFDLDIIGHINSEFSVLQGLGIGPENGFVIEDDTAEWDAYLSEPEDQVKLIQAKTCVWMRAKLLFDPPTSAFLLDAAKQQLQEFEWRLNVNREATEYADPVPPPVIPSGGQP